MAQSAYKTVSQLTQEIQDALECDFSQVTVMGEVSGFTAHRSGHWYLTLKDKNAQITSVVWRSSVARQKVQLEDGLQVVAQGRITVYAPRGNYQLIIDRIEPLGEGSWRAAFRKLHQKLAQEGLFDAQRKKPVPLVPRRVVVISSPTGAAIRDFLQVATRRWKSSEILVLPTRVQGPGAGQQLAAAVDLARRLRPKPDVLVLTRGGGSIEDLWEFNSEALVRAIAACDIPVVSGVGHEIDVTLCDLAADLRALTPSEAAERVFPDQQQLLQGLRHTYRQMQQSLLRQSRLARQRLDQLASARVFRQPLDHVETLTQKVDDLSNRLDRSIKYQLDYCQEKLAGMAAQLHSLSPLNILARGYSLTMDEQGKLVSSIEGLTEGQQLTTRLKDGQIVSQVQALRSEETPTD